MITPQYLGGFFDGEGSACITIFPRSVSVGLQFSNNSLAIIERVSEFLNENDIFPTFQTIFNQWGQVRIIRCSGLECKKLAELLLPHVVGKRRHLEIVLQVFSLKRKLVDANELISHHLVEFDVFRQELHSLAVKGPRELKPISRFFKTPPQRYDVRT